MNNSYFWDIMLNYEHRNHTDHTKSLVRFLKEAGIKYWYDIEQIDETDKLNRTELKNLLRQIALSSRIVLGYVRQEASVIDPLAGEAKRNFNWLFGEQQFASEILWINDYYLYSFPDHKIQFHGYPHLTYLLGLACGKGTSLHSFWIKYFGSLPKVNRQVFNQENMHDLNVEYLPGIINPNAKEYRRNKMREFKNSSRDDLDKDNRIQFF